MSVVDDLFLCLRFFSRLPMPAMQRQAEEPKADLATAAAMVPVAGAIIAVFPCLVLLTATVLNLPALLGGGLSIVSLVALTGALHEDGLADCADGFGGGTTRERKLEIMRDSHIGTFGACAIALSLYLRATALGIIAARSPMLGCAALVAAAAVSRTASLMPLVLLPPARSDGLGALAGRPAPASVTIAIGLAILIALTMIPADATLSGVATAVLTSAIGALVATSIAWRQIGGQTGDVAGAAQQVAEISFLLTFTAG